MSVVHSASGSESDSASVHFGDDVRAIARGGEGAVTWELSWNDESSEDGHSVSLEPVRKAARSRSPGSVSAGSVHFDGVVPQSGDDLVDMDLILSHESGDDAAGREDIGVSLGYGSWSRGSHSPANNLNVVDNAIGQANHSDVASDYSGGRLARAGSGVVTPSRGSQRSGPPAVGGNGSGVAAPASPSAASDVADNISLGSFDFVLGRVDADVDAARQADFDIDIDIDLGVDSRWAAESLKQQDRRAALEAVGAIGTFM